MKEKRPKVNFEPEAWVKLSELKPHPKNPRVDLTQYKEKFKSLKQSIKKGVFEPVKVSKLSGLCLAGHQRLKAFEALGYEEVPVMYNECKTEAEEVEVMIKDNNEWGMYEFGDLAALLDEFDLETENLGFSDLEMEELDLSLANEEEYGDEFGLNDGDKEPFQQMTFTMAAEQAQKLKEAIASVKKTEEFNFVETYGNENTNGNAIYLILTQWEQRT